MSIIRSASESIKSISRSVTKPFVSVANGVGKSIDYVNKIWTTKRWEIIVIGSILFLLLCWIFTKGVKSNKVDYDELYRLHGSERYHSNKRGEKKSNKYENECRRIVESTFGVPFVTVRPDFLKNPKTGRNLELDIYNEKLKLAIEYQGAQHRTYTPFFHKKYTDYLDQVARDEFKKKKCTELGIDLICIPDYIQYDNLHSYIREELRRIKRI